MQQPQHEQHNQFTTPTNSNHNSHYFTQGCGHRSACRTNQSACEKGNRNARKCRGPIALLINFVKERRGNVKGEKRDEDHRGDMKVEVRDEEERGDVKEMFGAVEEKADTKD